MTPPERARSGRRSPGARRPDSDQATAGGQGTSSEVRVRLRGARADTDLVLSILREVLPLEFVGLPDPDRNGRTVRQYCAVNAALAAEQHAARVHADGGDVWEILAAGLRPLAEPVEPRHAEAITGHATVMLRHWRELGKTAEAAGLDLDDAEAGSLGALLVDLGRLLGDLDAWATATADVSGLATLGAVENTEEAGAQWPTTS